MTGSMHTYTFGEGGWKNNTLDVVKPGDTIKFVNSFSPLGKIAVPILAYPTDDNNWVISSMLVDVNNLFLIVGHQMKLNVEDVPTGRPNWHKIWVIVSIDGIPVLRTFVYA